MKTQDTDQLGTIYTLFANELGAVVEIASPGEEVTLGSIATRTGRNWYIVGDKGMICWHAPTDETLTLCNRWLEHNRYEAASNKPPECFMYRKVASSL
jgi:hypothetical protein